MVVSSADGKDLRKNLVKQRLIENIKIVANQNGVNIGDIEESAGFSIGYLSRLTKEGNTTTISVDAVKAIAAKLEVTIDLLVNGNLNLVGQNEEYVLSFVDKLIMRTRKEELSWTKYSERELYRGMQHPLINKEFINYEWISNYESSFTDISDTAEMNGDLFEAFLDDETMVVISSISIRDDRFAFDSNLNILNRQYAYELYLRNGDNITPICSSVDVCSELATEMGILYRTISDMHGNVVLNPYSKSVIDSFMRDDKNGSY